GGCHGRPTPAHPALAAPRLCPARIRGNRRPLLPLPPRTPLHRALPPPSLPPHLDAPVHTDTDIVRLPCRARPRRTPPRAARGAEGHDRVRGGGVPWDGARCTRGGLYRCLRPRPAEQRRGGGDRARRADYSRRYEGAVGRSGDADAGAGTPGKIILIAGLSSLSLVSCIWTADRRSTFKIAIGSWAPSAALWSCFFYLYDQG
ncbi:hypothetical protein B0H11DRAFT_2295166, partial [Mycena galericulata]